MRRFDLLLLVWVLSASLTSSVSVEVEVGQNATLRCTYNTRTNSVLSACWNRGPLSTYGCYNQIIASEGRKVKAGSSASSRYQLLGALGQGDVSLTILNVTAADGGLYVCRVDIPGWFNDKKHQVQLIVTAAPATTFPATTDLQEPPERTTTARPTGQQTSTDVPLTSSSHSSDSEDNSNWTLILVLALFGVIILITLAAIMARRLSRSRKMCQPPAGSSIRFSSTSSSLQLHRQSSAVENIYQIDENEYEYSL